MEKGSDVKREGKSFFLWRDKKIFESRARKLIYTLLKHALPEYVLHEMITKIYSIRSTYIRQYWTLLLISSYLNRFVYTYNVYIYQKYQLI